jgi:hypothetical protein
MGLWQRDSSPCKGLHRLVVRFRAQSFIALAAAATDVVLRFFFYVQIIPD